MAADRAWAAKSQPKQPRRTMTAELTASYAERYAQATDRSQPPQADGREASRYLGQRQENRTAARRQSHKRTPANGAPEASQNKQGQRTSARTKLRHQRHSARAENVTPLAQMTATDRQRRGGTSAPTHTDRGREHGGQNTDMRKTTRGRASATSTTTRAARGGGAASRNREDEHKRRRGEARAPRYAPASGQDRPWYQVLGEGRCLGCSWARRMAASSIF